MAEVSSPAERTLIAQLDSVPFQRGVEEGRWILQHFKFPDLFVRVRAVDRDTGALAEYDFHLLCDGYPLPGPYVERWDFAANCRPAPPTTGVSPALADAMKAWGDGNLQNGGIYRPWQRGAAEHNAWAQKRPDLAWHAQRHIGFIMENLHDLVAEQAVWLAVRNAA